MATKGQLLPIKQLIKAGGLPGYLLLFHPILIFTVKRRRELDDYAAVDTSALLQIVFALIVFALVLHTFFTKGVQKFSFVKLNPNRFLLLYGVVCFLSLFWTPNVNITLYRAFEMLVYLLLISWTVYNLFMRLDTQNMVEWLVFWAVWAIVWSVATNIKVAGLNFLQNPFDAARLDYPMVIFFALLISKRKVFKVLILALAFFSFSNKIYLGFALGLAGFLFGNAKYKGLIFMGMIVLLGVLSFIDFEELLKQTVFIGRREVSLEDSSGRYYVWQVSWKAFLESPWIGHGFVAGENTVLFSKFEGAINSHNFLFSGVLGTGILGTLFLLGYFWTVFKMGLKSIWPKDKWKPAIMGTLIMSLVVSFTSPGIGSRVFGSWIGVVLVLTLIAALFYKFKLEKRQQSNLQNENNMGHP